MTILHLGLLARRATAASLSGAALLLAAAPSLAAVAVSVDAGADRRPINPLIYGVNFANSTQMSTMRYPLNRWGGNAVTRYNWKVDVGNHASDWFFLNIVEGGNPATLPHGSTADQFVDRTLLNGGEALITVPLIGWTPVSSGLSMTQARQKRWGFSIFKYGTQTVRSTDWGDTEPDAGNGECTNPPQPGKLSFCSQAPRWDIINNDPHDTSEEIDSSFVTDWIAHLQERVGTAAEGGVRYYALDNEPNLWNSTHRDVHPQPLTYDELWSKTLDIAAAVKQADPAAKILGPDSWGWCDYFTSAADAAVGPSCVNGADRAAHGGLPLLEWYLKQVCDDGAVRGHRLVDVLDIHYYPQGDCVAGLGWSDTYGDCAANAEHANVAAARLRALKELYDPAWISESWIGSSGEPPMRVLPRLRDWIAARCGGTGIAVTEFRWGIDDGATSALAEAEALAIYGREGVDMATRWVVPASGSRSEYAYRLFLDYDQATAGAQPIAGESVRASSANCQYGGPTSPSCDVTSYAVRGIAGELWLLLFNHKTTADTATVTFATPVAGPATLFRFNPANAVATRLVAVPAENPTVAANGLSLTSAVSLPPRTATLVKLVLPQGSAGLPFRDGFESGGMGSWR